MAGGSSPNNRELIRKDKQVKENKVINQEGRKITTTYTLDNNYRVKVSTYHYGNSKVIRSTVSECITSQSGIFTMETSSLFEDYHQIILSESAPRYSFAALEKQHANALILAAADVAALLAAGEANARECQNRAA